MLQVFWLAILVAPVPRAAAGVLRGAVVDERREPVVEARVALLSAEGKPCCEAVTGRHGGFTLSDVEDGSWILDVTAEGFRPATRRLSLPPYTDQVLVLERLPVPRADEESEAQRLRREREEASDAMAPLTPVPGDDLLPVPDRWRIGLPHWDRYPRTKHTDSPFESGSLLNPYNQNVLKGDYPIAGQDLFLVLSAVSDTFLEARRLPTPSGASAQDPGSQEFFGRGEQLFAPSLLILSADLFRGSTAFRPFDWRVRITPVAAINYLHARERGVVGIDVREGTGRTDTHVGLQELFGEAKIADVSPHFDFVSVRSGIQPFVSDFRGFLFSDNEPGLRLFGNWGANRNQWNAAGFDMLEKDTNSGLNTRARRHQRVYIANYYRQDFLTPGYTLTVSWHRNDDRAGSKDPGGLHFDANGFLVRPAPIGDFTPHDLEVDYFGWGGDGHIGRLNLTHVAYLARGHEDHNPIAGRRTDVRAFMGAAELSVDRDWARYKGSLLYASGDGEPLDGRARGFDAILDNPNFAGGQASIWHRQSFRLTQTFVGLVQRASLLPSLRTSKEEGQANFVNPGLVLLNAGSDLELTPKLELQANLNYLRFNRTEVLELLLFQAPIRKTIGLDASIGFQYRPFLTDNFIVGGGIAALRPGSGLRDLFITETFLSAFGAVTLAY